MKPCVFCKLEKEQVDTELRVFENEHVFAQISFLQKPNNLGHALVIPKAHIQNIYELPTNLDAPIMAAIRRLARTMKTAFSADGINIRQNNEPAAGQDVFHLHFHVVPRFTGDDFDRVDYRPIDFEIRKQQAETLKLHLVP